MKREMWEDGFERLLRASGMCWEEAREAYPGVGEKLLREAFEEAFLNAVVGDGTPEQKHEAFKVRLAEHLLLPQVSGHLEGAGGVVAANPPIVADHDDWTVGVKVTGDGWELDIEPQRKRLSADVTGLMTVFEAGPISATSHEEGLLLSGRWGGRWLRMRLRARPKRKKPVGVEAN